MITNDANKAINIKLLCFYEKLLYLKTLEHVDGFLKRVEALKTGRADLIEFVEIMVLRPLEEQLEYLHAKEAELLQKLLERGTE